MHILVRVSPLHGAFPVELVPSLDDVLRKVVSIDTTRGLSVEVRAVYSLLELINLTRGLCRVVSPNCQCLIQFILWQLQVHCHLLLQATICETVNINEVLAVSHRVACLIPCLDPHFILLILSLLLIG